MAIALHNVTVLGKTVHFKEKKSFVLGRKTRVLCGVAMRNRNNNNFYELLSLDPSRKKIGFDEIKRAYRSQALKFHPDTCSSSTKDESTRHFLEIKKAYETLSDPILREIYDEDLRFGCDGEGKRRNGMMMVKRGSKEFSREVLQRQLSGLKKRSMERVGKKIH
ncbi:OLC1v1009195C1 [Oldenlandia corymbosa var. corymbosa]|uniref:OLC1v1009195C1 n=1 Tax=Oldenlandia corymbosa var. corymbosa TaxID=529605 RepID=A0AAV1DPV9_OLDCO|nr:OLC1v1009195C1 [Oldenlandia corymbosa var. corymbosa]